MSAAVMIARSGKAGSDVRLQMQARMERAWARCLFAAPALQSSEVVSMRLFLASSGPGRSAFNATAWLRSVAWARRWFAGQALTCAAGLLHCVAAAHSAEPPAACLARLPPAHVAVTTAYAIPQVNFRHSAGEIRLQLGSGAQSIALGMTQASTSFILDISLTAVSLRDPRRLCARPRIELTLRHSVMEVWLASEIQHDECVADVVLKHELRHVEIERETLAAAAGAMQALLSAYYAERAYLGSEDEIKAELADEFEHRWAVELNALLQAGNGKHLTHDQTDATHDAQACAGELVRVARQLQ